MNISPFLHHKWYFADFECLHLFFIERPWEFHNRLEDRKMSFLLSARGYHCIPGKKKEKKMQDWRIRVESPSGEITSVSTLPLCCGFGLMSLWYGFVVKVDLWVKKISFHLDHNHTNIFILSSCLESTNICLCISKESIRLLSWMYFWTKNIRSYI